MISHSLIECKGKPLFERARFSTPYSYTTTLAERACFFYIVEGAYETIDPHGSISLNAKEALVKKCGNHISRYLKTPDHDECEAVVVYFHPETIKDVFQHDIPEFAMESPVDEGPIRYFDIDLVSNFVKHLMVYFDNPAMMDDELATIKLKELILILMKSKQRNSVRQFFSEIFYPEKLRFQSIIENNLYSNLKTEELAHLCHMSLSTFKRSFMASYKDSPARYIKRKKLERAAHLLSHTPEMISNIAYDSGFEDLTTFSDSFRKHFGKSPTNYRLDQTRNTLGQ